MKWRNKNRLQTWLQHHTSKHDMIMACHAQEEDEQQDDYRPTLARRTHGQEGQQKNRKQKFQTNKQTRLVDRWCAVSCCTLCSTCADWYVDKSDGCSFFLLCYHHAVAACYVFFIVWCCTQSYQKKIWCQCPKMSFKMWMN